MEEVTRGDQSAFKEIFKRYWEKLYAIAYNRLQSKQGAEDVVQDVLSTLWIRREETRIEHLGKYLATAVKYCVFYEIRKKQLQETMKQGFEHVYTNIQQLTPADDLLYNAFVQELELEKNKLPQKCKLVFQYSREYGLSNKEIAEKLNLSPKTVEAHITRAIRQLRTAFKGPKNFIFF